LPLGRIFEGKEIVVVANCTESAFIDFAAVVAAITSKCLNYVLAFDVKRQRPSRKV
jgi:hypothetical protein